MENAVIKIPYVRPVRIGNYKLWRSKVRLSVYPDVSEEERKRMVAEKGKLRKEAFDVECINVSNLDGTWKVQIPATYQMFAILDALYNDYCSAEEKTHRYADAVLRTILGNMLFASSIPNGYYHRALDIVASCYAQPDMLDKKSKSHGDLMKDVSSLVNEFLEWHEACKNASLTDEDAEVRKEDVLEQVQDIIKEEDAS